MEQLRSTIGFLRKHQLLFIAVLIVSGLYLFVNHRYEPNTTNEKSYYTNVKELFTLLSSISITAGILSLLFTHRGNNFSLVSNCMTRYSDLLPDLIKIEIQGEHEAQKREKIDAAKKEDERKENRDAQGDKGKIDNQSSDEEEKIDRLTHVQMEIVIRRYFDLSNEQLFYVENGLVPSSIEDMWIKGIKIQLENIYEAGVNLETEPFKLADIELHKHLYPYIEEIEASKEIEAMEKSEEPVVEDGDSTEE